MRVEVLMASGDREIWPNSDAQTEDGYLQVLRELSEEPTPDMKLMRIETEAEEASLPELAGRPYRPARNHPPTTISKLYHILAVYAPGMWIRVVFDE